MPFQLSNIGSDSIVVLISAPAQQQDAEVLLTDVKPLSECDSDIEESRTSLEHTASTNTDMKVPEDDIEAHELTSNPPDIYIEVEGSEPTTEQIITAFLHFDETHYRFTPYQREIVLCILTKETSNWCWQMFMEETFTKRYRYRGSPHSFFTEYGKFHISFLPQA